MIGPANATLADVAAAYEDLGDAHYQADEVGDHAAEWRAQQNLDATVNRVAAREGVSRSQVRGQALAFAPGPRNQVTAVAEASPTGQVPASFAVEAPGAGGRTVIGAPADPAAREVEDPATAPAPARQSAAPCLPGPWHGLGVHLRTCPAAVADGVPGAMIRRWELASEARAPEPEAEAAL